MQKAPREVIWSNLCMSRYDVLLRKWQMRISAEGTALSDLGLSTLLWFVLFGFRVTRCHRDFSAKGLCLCHIGDMHHKRVQVCNGEKK